MSSTHLELVIMFEYVAHLELVIMLEYVAKYFSYVLCMCNNAFTRKDLLYFTYVYMCVGHLLAYGYMFTFVGSWILLVYNG